MSLVNIFWPSQIFASKVSNLGKWSPKYLENMDSSLMFLTNKLECLSPPSLFGLVPNLQVSEHLAGGTAINLLFANCKSEHLAGDTAIKLFCKLQQVETYFTDAWDR